MVKLISHFKDLVLLFSTFLGPIGMMFMRKSNMERGISDITLVRISIRIHGQHKIIIFTSSSYLPEVIVYSQITASCVQLDKNVFRLIIVEFGNY